MSRPVRSLIPAPLLQMADPCSVYFYCVPAGPPENSAFQHCAVCLAEGLRALGIPFFSNTDYWRLSASSDQHLFNHDPSVSPGDCSIIVLNQEWLEHNDTLPRELFKTGRTYRTVFVDHLDGSFTDSWRPEMRQFDIIFKAHYNKDWPYPSNCRPWPFGLSNRIMEQTERIPPFRERRRAMLFNFRVHHAVRDVAKLELQQRFRALLPLDEKADAFGAIPQGADDHLQWRQTGRRHYPSYYQTLKQLVACAAFGGFFVPPLFDSGPAAAKWGERLTRRLDPLLSAIGMRPTQVLQWDSWRFWEALSAGCVTFHVDFDKYGARMPVMPQNWKHYIGIDLDHVDDAVERISAEPMLLENISVSGREWARENYSPVATAARFLNALGMDANVPNRALL